MAYRVIVVDDETKIRSGILYAFPWKQMGFEIVADFDSSLRALEYIGSNAVDVVLTDIKMPILNGVELAQKIRELGLQTEIIFISGFRDFEYAKSAIRLGARQYITKPLNRDEVIAAFLNLRTLLDSRAPPPVEQEESPLYYQRIMQVVKEHIDNHLATATLESAALAAALSSGYLSRLFKQKTGEGFSDYLLRRKMERAAVLLRDISLKTYEIAEAVGYDNPKNFSRSFKQFYGVSPREYRKEGLKPT